MMDIDELFDLAKSARRGNDQGEGEDVTVSDTCGICKTGSFIFRDEYVCENCGFIDTGRGNFDCREEGFRMSGVTTNGANSRVGRYVDPVERLRFSEGYLNGSVIKGRNQAERRMALIHRNLSCNNSDNSQQRNDIEIGQFCEVLNLTEEMMSTAKMYWADLRNRLATEGIFRRGAPRRSLMALCISTASSEYGRNLTMETLSEVVKVDTCTLAKSRKVWDLYKSHSIQSTGCVVRPQDLIAPLNGETLGMTPTDKMRIRGYLADLEARTDLQTRKPKSLAAAAIIKNMPGVSVARVLEALNVTRPPVMTILKLL